MRRQKSFESNTPSLYLVATPIGNLGEFSERAIEVLNEVDIIACEDTRTSSKLLSHFGITTKTIAHHKHNEKVSSDGIIKLLEEGKNVALISDAGYPLISDPGYVLCQEVIEAGYHAIPVSGSNAMLAALVASGLSTEHFMFYGFLESTSSKQKKELELLKEYPFTLIFYEAPHRINKTLASLLEVFGNRNICIARELTKKHEEFIRCTLEESIELEELKGEIVIVVEGCSDVKEWDDDSIIELVDSYVAEGISTKDAIKKVSKDIDVAKNRVYEIVLKNKQS